MDLHLSLVNDRPVGRQIYEQVRDAIVDGRLATGERLPATRGLARQLAVARNTVVWAYELLAAEGYVEGKVGAGSVVRSGAGQPPARRASHGVLRARPLWDDLPASSGPAAPPVDFRLGAPDVDLFPAAHWRRLVMRELRAQEGVGRYYGDPAGQPRLREAIARHAAVSRSIVCAPGDVLVTAGAQQAFDLIGRCLLEPGDIVAMEDPGYDMARFAFTAQGARIVPVRVDADGLVVDELPARARIVFATPSHQFPMGVPMSLARRHALLDWAERAGAAVIEDDYNGEFRFDGRPLEPLQRLDRHGRVLFVGSFSKVLHPGLRLGYLVAPPSLSAALRKVKLLADLHGPFELQGAMAALIEGGGLAAHIRRVRAAYGPRRDRLRAALTAYLPQLSLLPSVAGLHVGMRLPAAWREADVLAAARAAGIGLNGWSQFAVGPVSPGISLGFGRIGMDAIEPGVARLADALSGL
jgi:GntR family transcriptional regulator / MocR family aminotransferase